MYTPPIFYPKITKKTPNKCFEVLKSEIKLYCYILLQSVERRLLRGSSNHQLRGSDRKAESYPVACYGNFGSRRLLCQQIYRNHSLPGTRMTTERLWVRESVKCELP